MTNEYNVSINTLMRNVPKPICGIAVPGAPDAKGRRGTEYWLVLVAIRMKKQKSKAIFISQTENKVLYTNADLCTVQP